MVQPPSMIEEEFNARYDTEHVPERLAVPGVETAVRFSSTTGAAPKYLAMYDLSAEPGLDTDACEIQSPVRIKGLPSVR